MSNSNMDRPYDTKHKDIVFGDILMHLGKGAGLGAAIFFGPIIIIYIIYLIGTGLPPESRDTPDPTPDSFSMIWEDRSDIT